MTSNKSLSKCIEELVEVWLLWMKNNNIVNDRNSSITLRKESAIQCEDLIKREYELVAMIDEYFELCQKKNN